MRLGDEKLNIVSSPSQVGNAMCDSCPKKGEVCDNNCIFDQYFYPYWYLNTGAYTYKNYNTNIIPITAYDNILPIVPLTIKIFKKLR